MVDGASSWAELAGPLTKSQKLTIATVQTLETALRHNEQILPRRVIANTMNVRLPRNGFGALDPT